MSSAALRCRMNFMHTKAASTPKKTDLDSIWNTMITTPLSSPSITPKSKKDSSVDFLSSLTLQLSKTPKKTLYCPPVIETPKAKKIKTTEFEHLFTNVTFSSSEKLDLEEILDNYITFVYKGGDNQEAAWNDFKKKVANAEHSFVMTSNLRMYFTHNEVKAKGLTITAQDQIESITCSDGSIDFEKAIDLIDNLSKSEKLSIFSSGQFHYSTITPVLTRRSEVGTSSGKSHRLTLIGYVFPDIISIVTSQYENITCFKVSV